MSLFVRRAGGSRQQERGSEAHVLRWALSAALPMGLALSWVIRDNSLSFMSRTGISALIVLWMLVAGIKIRAILMKEIRTLSSLVESIRQHDYSVRGGRAAETGELGELYRQINALSESLRVSRQGEHDVLNVLEQVVSEINVAIVVFDPHDRISLVNRQACALLKAPAERLTGSHWRDTVLAELPVSSEPRLIDFRFPGAEGRWQIKQNWYRQQGQASRIVFIADLKQALSDQEIAAWQRLIRVISHEVNNSLTPITSLCQTLSGILHHGAPGMAEDVTEGLAVIGKRAKGLQHFISAYARLAQLPEPHRVMFPVGDLALRLKRIFHGQPLEIAAFPPGSILGDPVHLEQALINLAKNALEASPNNPVHLSCRFQDTECEFEIADRGSGIGNPDNLFVPFYTTKPQGAGIGLVLCRQIAAGHRGYVSLENRSDGVGAVAKLVLPMPSPE